MPKAFREKIKFHKVIQSSASLTLPVRKRIKLLVQKRLFSSHSAPFIVLQSKLEAVIHKLLNKMRTNSQLTEPEVVLGVLAVSPSQSQHQ